MEINEFLAQIAILLQSSDECSNKYDFYLGKVYFVKFSFMQTMRMPQEFRKQFRAQGSTAHIRVDTFNGIKHYRIRYDDHNDYFVEVDDASLKEVKYKFIEQVILKYGETDNVRRMARSVVRGL